MGAHRKPATALWRRRPMRVTGAAAAFFTVLVLFAGAAFAYWQTSGSGGGTATAATLNAPTNVAVPGTSGGAVSVSWTASAGTPSPTGYYVTRIKSDNTAANACGTSPSSTITGTSCTDSVPASGSYTYTVTAVYHSWTATSTAGGPVVVTLATATKLAFTTQPPTSRAASAFTVAVTVEDASNNPVQVSGRSVTVAIGTNPGGGTLSGTLTTTTNATGVATFSDLSINKTGNGYRLTAASAGLTGATSNTFDITPGTATQLAFTRQPSSSPNGGTQFAQQPIVTVQDANGNTVISSSALVTLSVTGAPAGVNLTCNANPVSASAGVASFTGCKIDKAGGPYTLTATSSGLTDAQSNAINVGVGPAAKLVFSHSPTDSTGGIAFGTQPQVQVVDAGGNLVSGATNSITLSITGSPADATLSCPGGNSKAAVSGVATFSGCSIDKSSATAYTLTASATGLTDGTSASFSISTGAAAKLCFYGGTGGTGTACLSTTQTVSISKNATFTGQVHLVDAGGNDVLATSTINITVATSGSQFGGPSPTLVTITAGSAASNTFTFSTPSGNGKPGMLSGTVSPSGFTIESIALST